MPHQPDDRRESGSPILTRLQPWAASDVDATRLAERLGTLVELILEANRRMNLTSDRAPPLFWSRHVEDALAAAAAIEGTIGRPDASMRVLDVGSGAGVPGLIWAILWPDTRMVLLDSRQKKARFLESAARELGLPRVETIAGRAETYGRHPDHREQYDLVAARALAPMPTLVELTLPFVRVGGVAAAIKSADSEAEIEAARRAIARLGGGENPPRRLDYRRADGQTCAVWLVSKRSPTPPQFPRRPGLPRGRPLSAA